GPNACNLCHLDKSIDWTLGYLKSWHQKTFDEQAIAKSYSNRQEPLGRLWLNHSYHAVRLVAADAYGRRQKVKDLPELLGILDDKYLINRQFGQMVVEAIACQGLEKLGYSFALAPEARRAAAARVRERLGGIATTPSW